MTRDDRKSSARKSSDLSERSSEIAERLFVVACALGIVTGVITTAGMLLAAAAFATASTFVIPLVVTFEGFRDAGGTNAVTVTGSWSAAGALTIVLAFLLSFVVLRRSASPTIRATRT